MVKAGSWGHTVLYVQYKRLCCTQGDCSLNEELYKEEQLEERKKDGQSKLPNLTVGGTDTSCYFQLLNQIGILFLKTIRNYFKSFSPGTRRFSVLISFMAHGFRGIRGHRIQSAHEQVAVSSLKSKEDVIFPMRRRITLRTWCPKGNFWSVQRARSLTDQGFIWYLAKAKGTTKGLTNW